MTVRRSVTLAYYFRSSLVSLKARGDLVIYGAKQRREFLLISEMLSIQPVCDFLLGLRNWGIVFVMKSHRSTLSSARLNLNREKLNISLITKQPIGKICLNS